MATDPGRPTGGHTDVGAQTKVLTDFLRSTAPHTSTRAQFDQAKQTFADLLPASGRGTSDPLPQGPTLAVATTRVELAKWLEQAPWARGSKTFLEVLGQDRKAAETAALAAFGTRINQLSAQATGLLQQSAAAGAAQGALANGRSLEPLLQEARLLAQFGGRLSASMDDAYLLMRCFDQQKWIDRMVGSLHAWRPEAVSDEVRQDVQYWPKTLGQMQRLHQALPQLKGLPELEVAQLVDKQRSPRAHAQKPGHAGIPEALLFPQGKMLTKRVATSGHTTLTLQSADSSRSGAHGKVFRATDDLGEGGPLIVKQQRTEFKRRPGVQQLPEQLPNMLAKAARSAEGQRRIDKLLMRSPNLFAAPTGALRGLMADAGSAAMTQHFVNEFGKYFQVMTAMDGDLVDLHHGLVQRSQQAQSLGPNALVPVQQARLSVAAQAFLQLQGLHTGKFSKDRGIAHRDLKLANILFLRSGSVRLIDLDESKAVGTPGLRRAAYERQGTLLSPEMFLPLLRKVKQVLGKPNDVWALGATLLDLGFRDPSPAPWAAALHTPLEGQRSLNGAEHFALYAAWHSRLVAGGAEGAWATPTLSGDLAAQVASQAVATLQANDPSARTRPPNSKGPSTQELLTVAAQQLHSFFYQRHQEDPALTDLLLQRALVPRPEHRARAKQLSRELLRRMDKVDDADRAAVVDLFAAAADRT